MNVLYLTGCINQVAATVINKAQEQWCKEHRSISCQEGHVRVGCSAGYTPPATTGAKCGELPLTPHSPHWDVTMHSPRHCCYCALSSSLSVTGSQVHHKAGLDCPNSHVPKNFQYREGVLERKGSPSCPWRQERAGEVLLVSRLCRHSCVQHDWHNPEINLGRRGTLSSYCTLHAEAQKIKVNQQRS